MAAPLRLRQNRSDNQKHLRCLRNKKVENQNNKLGYRSLMRSAPTSSAHRCVGSLPWPCERPHHLHTYSRNCVCCTFESGFLECLWRLSCFILMYLKTCMKFACGDNVFERRCTSGVWKKTVKYHLNVVFQTIFALNSHWLILWNAFRRQFFSFVSSVTNRRGSQLGWLDSLQQQIVS